MTTEEARSVTGTPFSVVRKGFDPTEVCAYFDRFPAELRVVVGDREAERARVRDLTHDVEDAVGQIAQLRIDVDKQLTTPVPTDSMTELYAATLQLAYNETGDVREQAKVDAVEARETARRTAADLRTRHESRLAEVQEQCHKFDLEFEQTMASARCEAAQIIANARAEADRITAVAEAKRTRELDEFETAMRERRAKITASLDAAEQAVTAEAAQRIQQADDEARRILEAADLQSERKHIHANGLVERVQAMRTRVLDQLLGMRSELDTAPTKLATVDDEPGLMEELEAAVPTVPAIGHGFADSAGTDAAVAVVDKRPKVLGGLWKSVSRSS